MRPLSFWSGIVCAMLCGFVDPVWGYAAVAVLSLVQLSMLGGSGGSVFLLIHYAAILTYFSIAPAMQIAHDLEFWDAGVMRTESHTQALMLLLLYMAGIEAARLGRHLWPVTTEQFKAQAGCRLADHNNGAVTRQRQDQLTLFGRFRQCLNLQQWQAAAEHPLRRQRCRQGRRLWRRTGQQQAPGVHAWPASPYTAARIALAPWASNASATCTPNASASATGARPSARNSRPPSGWPTKPRSHSCSSSSRA